MKKTFYVWLDLELNDVLAVEKNIIKDKFLKQLNKENIEYDLIKGKTHVEAINSYKLKHNIHSQAFKEVKNIQLYH